MPDLVPPAGVCTISLPIGGRPSKKQPERGKGEQKKNLYRGVRDRKKKRDGTRGRRTAVHVPSHIPSFRLTCCVCVLVNILHFLFGLLFFFVRLVCVCVWVFRRPKGGWGEEMFILALLLLSSVESPADTSAIIKDDDLEITYTGEEFVTRGLTGSSHFLAVLFVCMFFLSFFLF